MYERRYKHANYVRQLISYIRTWLRDSKPRVRERSGERSAWSAAIAIWLSAGVLEGALANLSTSELLIDRTRPQKHGPLSRWVLFRVVPKRKVMSSPALNTTPAFVACSSWLPRKTLGSGGMGERLSRSAYQRKNVFVCFDTSCLCSNLSSSAFLSCCFDLCN